MKNLCFYALLFFVCFFSCKQKESNGFQATNKEKVIQKTLDDTVSVNYILIKRNPAESYFFSRKYKIEKNGVSYFDRNVWKDIDSKYVEGFENLLDSIPQKYVLSKEMLGHSTLEVDIPDWKMELYLNSEDTLYWYSGELPEDMGYYNEMVWKYLNKWDNSKTF